MKNLLLTFLFSVSFLAIGTSQVSFGGGAAYIDDIGIQARVNIPVDNLTIIPKATYFFVDGASFYKFDGDVALTVANIADENPLYVFAGPSINRVSVSFLGTSISSTEIGLNLGAGTRFSNIYVEAGYNMLFCDGCTNEIGFAAGYMF